MLVAFLLGLLAVWQAPAQARPSAERLTRVVQPDGTVLMLRVRGDEWSHWYETAAGNRVVQDPKTKAWVYVTAANGTTTVTNKVAGQGPAPSLASQVPPPTLSPLAQKLRAGAAQQSVPLPGQPRRTKQAGARLPQVVAPTGTGRIPILLVTFKDRPVGGANSPIYNPSDFQSMLFSTTAGARTMVNMYKQMSENTFTVTSAPSGISGWWQAPENHDYYGEDNPGTTGGGNDKHPDQLVRETVQAADATYNFGPYDTDNDGFVDCVFVVHQGTDQADGGSVTDIWSHRSKLTDFGPFWWGDGAIETNDVNANGVKVKVNDYVICPELANPNGVNAGNLSSAGVFCHEYGHALGLPDLYDIQYDTQGIGNWSLMSGGVNNGITQTGDCPAYMDAWCRWQLGWLTATVYSQNTRDVDIPEAKTDNYGMYLWTNGADSNQYFLVENRQRTGFDAALPGDGLLVYHCDDNIHPGDNTDNSRQWWYNGTTGSTTQGHRRVALVQADNLFNLDRTLTSAQNGGDISDPFPGNPATPVRFWDNNTLPNSRKYNTGTSSGFGAKTHVGLRNISDSSALMTADVVVRADKALPTIVIKAPAKNAALKSPGTAAGTANDDNGVKFVRVSLKRRSDGVWWNWTTNGWGSSTYDFPTNAKNATGTYNWSLPLPSLPDGSYEVQAQSVDFEDKASAWTANAFTLDTSAPTVAFDPLKNNDTLFTFEQIGGTVTGAKSVTFQIMEKNSPGGTDRFWNGTSWVNPDGSGQGPTLGATITSNKWAPTAPNKLPNRAQTRPGPYVFGVVAKDAAGNENGATIQITRSAADTTPPLVSIQSPPSPLNNAVLTSPNFAGLSGAVVDYESGISSVVLFIIKDPTGTRQFWNGSAWQTGDYALAAKYNANLNGWYEPATGYTRPSGTNLPNGKYQIQVHAFNRESPQLKSIAFSNFSVDFHPIYQWTGATMRDSDPNNNSNDWDVAANWNPTDGGPYGVPGADAIAVIANGDTVVANGSHQVYRLDISGSTLNTTGLYLTKGLNQSNANVNGGAVSLPSGAVWTWTGGNVGGTWGILPGASAVFSGATYGKTLSDGTVINNDGIITWSGNALQANNYSGGAILNNKSGALFKAGTGNLMGIIYGNGNVLRFNNLAGAKFQMTSTSSSSKLQIGSWRFVNDGEVSSSGGIVEFNTRVELNPGGTFTGTGTHQFVGGDIILDGTTTVSGAKFTVLGGNLTDLGNGSGALSTTAGGRVDWLGGTLVGTLTLNAGGVMGIGDPSSGPVSKYFADGAVFNNKGNVTWTGIGSILANNYSGGATWNNVAGSTFTAASNAAFGIVYGNGNPLAFNNNSSANFVKTAGSINGATTIGWKFNNKGKASTSAGYVSLTGGGDSSGTFSTVAGTAFKFTSGTFGLLSGTKLNGTGKVQILGGIVNASGALTDTTSTGGFEVASGELNGVNGGATLTTSGGFNWTGGNLGGMLTMAAGSVFTASGSNSKVFSDGATLTNYGTMSWTGPGSILANNYSGGAVINNESGGTVNVADGTPFGVVYGNGNLLLFNNKTGSHFVKNTGTGTTTVTTWNFANAGEIQSASGKLEFLGNLTLAFGTTLTGSGNIRLAGTVSQTGPVKTTGKVALDGGSYTGAGTATYPANYTGVLDWTNGTLAGTVTLTAGSQINVKDPGATGTDKIMADGSVLINKGTIQWSGKGAIRANNYSGGAIINNESGAVFRMLNDGTPFGVVYGNGNLLAFNNKTGALFVKSAGSGATSFTNWIFNNNAEIQPASGTLEFISRLNLQSGSTLTGAGTVRFGGDVMMDATVNAACKVLLDDGNLYGFVPATGTPPAVYTGTGLFEWTNGSISGTLTLAANARLSIHDRSNAVTDKIFADGAVFNNSGQVMWSGQGRVRANNYSGGLSWNNLLGSSFAIANDGNPFGIIYGNGNPVVFDNRKGASLIKTGGAGSAVLTDWTINNKGDLVCNSGLLDNRTALNLNDGGTISGLTQVLASAGTTTLTGQTLVNGTIFEVSGGSLVGNAGSSIAGGRFDWTGGTLFGTLTTAIGSSTYIHGANNKDFADGAAFLNQGTVTWYEAGSLRANNYSGGATFTNAKGATFTMDSSGSFTTVYGNGNPLLLKNAGLLNVKQGSGQAGIATVGWGFEQTLDGTLYVDINGANAATPEFDQIFLGANAKLAGKLSLNRLSSYLPAVGTGFKIMTYGSRTGTFSVLNSSIDATRKFTANYNANDLTLTVDAVPSGSLTSGSAAMMAPASTVLLSLATGDAARNSVRLMFTAAVDVDSARNPGQYKVTVDGLPVEVQGVSVQGNSITLLLEEGRLQRGDGLTVEYRGLKDALQRSIPEKPVHGVVK